MSKLSDISSIDQNPSSGQSTSSNQINKSMTNTSNSLTMPAPGISTPTQSNPLLSGKMPSPSSQPQTTPSQKSFDYRGWNQMYLNPYSSNQSQTPYYNQSNQPAGGQTQSVQLPSQSQTSQSQSNQQPYRYYNDQVQYMVNNQSNNYPYYVYNQGNNYPNNYVYQGQNQTQQTQSSAPSSTFSQPDTVNLDSTSTVGQYQPPGIRPRVTTTMWEDEKTLCYQVDANNVSVVRRADNNMINGTKLLNVAHMTRGRRDGILKSEKVRHVVKIGSMHLKGVWIPFERALAMAQREGIVDLLYPLFVRDIKRVIQTGVTPNAPQKSTSPGFYNGVVEPQIPQNQPQIPQNQPPLQSQPHPGQPQPQQPQQQPQQQQPSQPQQQQQPPQQSQPQQSSGPSGQKTPQLNNQQAQGGSGQQPVYGYQQSYYPQQYYPYNTYGYGNQGAVYQGYQYQVPGQPQGQMQKIVPQQRQLKKDDEQ